MASRKGVTVDVKVIDRGWIDIQKRIAQLATATATVTVGVQGAKGAANHQHSTLTVGQLATIHEFGKVIHTRRATIVIPERSFIRATCDIYRDKIAQREVLLQQGFVIGKFGLVQSLELLGTYVVGLIKARIATGIPPANRPSTIRRKGSSKPLVDTGQLRNSITYQVQVTT